MDIMENELVNVAMQIILHAGDARLRVEDALAQAKQFHFDEAKQKIAEAEECIHQAHVAQTEVIQNETRGKTYEPCLLFAHAQDTPVSYTHLDVYKRQMFMSEPPHSFIHCIMVFLV